MESQQLVAEFMIFSASLVAEFMAKWCKDKAILRSNSDFEQEKKDHMTEFFYRAGMAIDVTNTKTLGNSIAQIQNGNNPEKKTVLTVLKQKLMSNMNSAKYFCIGDKQPEEYKHFSMNL